jgi:hypothetical protein
MLTVRNNLASHLVIPRGTGTGEALKLTPKGTAEVETLTAPLRDAERNGLVTLGEVKPGAPAAEPPTEEVDATPDAAPEPEDGDIRPDAAPEPERTDAIPDTGPEPETGEELLVRILALVAEGKSQRDIARDLGVNRNVVQRALRRHGQGAGTEE